MAPPNVPNLSPIDEDVRIETQEEQQLDQQIDKHIRQIDKRARQIGKCIGQTDVCIEEIDKLALRLNATKHNANAQYVNYTAYKDTDSLVPLHHYLTDEDIPGFPDKTGDINLLHSKKIDTILKALCVCTKGTLEEKRERLHRSVGIALPGCILGPNWKPYPKVDSIEARKKGV